MGLRRQGEPLNTFGRSDRLHSRFRVQRYDGGDWDIQFASVFCYLLHDFSVYFLFCSHFTVQRYYEGEGVRRNALRAKRPSNPPLREEARA